MLASPEVVAACTERSFYFGTFFAASFIEIEPVVADRGVFMHCPKCGKFVLIFRNRCGHCGADQSPFLHFLGVFLGVVGSVIGFTIFDIPGAFIGGFLGILLYVVGSRLIFRK